MARANQHLFGGKMQLLAYSFERAREFIQVVHGKLEASAWPELTIIMSDRTAQRDFALDPVAGEGATSAPLSLVSRQLHALAALGGPGTGLVGAGPMLGLLHRLGLGSDKDLAECLAACGVSNERVDAVTSTLRNGGVLAFVTEESERELLRERGQELAFEVPETAHPANAPVVAPQAPIAGQHAIYNPLFMPTDPTDRNR
jgi:hypothetical protein